MKCDQFVHILISLF